MGRLLRGCLVVLCPHFVPHILQVHVKADMRQSQKLMCILYPGLCGTSYQELSRLSIILVWGILMSNTES